MPLRLVMMGTGSFALPTFLALYDTAHVVRALVTQPDRTGRGHHHHAHPMKEAAVEHGTPVLQPSNVNSPDAVDALKRLEPDLCVVAAYGQILKPEVISVPRHGAINVHASLLPKYRGAAPIQYAILRGETETGVTIFQLEPQLDAGPILGVVKTPLGPAETAGELEERLADLAAPLTLQVIDQIESGNVESIPQDPALVTRAPRLKKSAGAIDWSRSSAEIGRHVRAMQPWPNPFTFLRRPSADPLRLIVLEVEPADELVDAQPGTVVHADRSSFHVRTGDGVLRIKRLKPEGKRPMSTQEFLCGYAVRVGDRFVASPPA